ncbi:LysR family transcriptional regulator [Jongsikchunia kroppenstedtii]|uniref:LysR family transcriptional regulator n=1 Tax=Jongsikchunia kroppenstedtii TaxID=1121721 RepID=UPI0005BD3341|nr:LysR family transcriptional regulator [Jongsikchunia kroppenstedtii]
MPRTFDITPLRSLVAVACTGGVHRAAASLMITQSAVSQHLRKLEKEAGVALVSREGRRIAFTRDGEELLAHARGILAAHDGAVARFDKSPDTVITVGAAQNSAGVILPVAVARLREAFPDTEVRFHLDRNANIRSLLESGQVDIAVTTRVAPELSLRSSGFRLCWLWSATAAAPAPDAAVPLVVFSPPCTLRQPSFDAFSVSGRSWSVAAEINDLATGLDTVRSGAGAMLVPVLDRLPDGLIALPGAPKPPPVQLGVVYTDRTRVAVRDTIAAVLAEHVGDDRVELLHSSAYPLSAI